MVVHAVRTNVLLDRPYQLPCQKSNPDQSENRQADTACRQLQMSNFEQFRCANSIATRMLVVSQTQTPQSAQPTETMAIEIEAPKFSGCSVPLPGLGRVKLTKLLHQNSETAIVSVGWADCGVWVWDTTN